MYFLITCGWLVLSSGSLSVLWGLPGQNWLVRSGVRDATSESGFLHANALHSPCTVCLLSGPEVPHLSENELFTSKEWLSGPRLSCLCIYGNIVSALAQVCGVDPWGASWCALTVRCGSQRVSTGLEGKPSRLCQVIDAFLCSHHIHIVGCCWLLKADRGHVCN